ncbi:MAG: RES family NAD+ phosphorylase, partial [Burkholderiales bacterium]
ADYLGEKQAGLTGYNSVTHQFYGPDEQRDIRRSLALDAMLSAVPFGRLGVANGVGAVNKINFDARPAGISFDGTVYRLEDPSRVSTTWDIHKWNIASDHRYSGSRYGATYGATSQATAIAEVNYYGVSAGRVVVNKQVSVSNVLDLTNLDTLRQLNISYSQITGNSYSITQQIGNWARQNGYDGILAPSARQNGGTNLVIFPKAP